ncbi:SET domain-containing protein 3 [Podospora australis]|uniref:SET domain-containing protein 3 n=1 Tax=Podospora australis TaxID=1536484 RepID=A0AAN6X2D7_9PEZI|nr:SET domain-containing protein 3 [Podospora australis]
MTDKLPPLLTPIAPPSQTFQLSPSLPAGATTVQDDPRKQEAMEEEPYTIKCICTFTGDDGNTILCETCDTWQHIECYYPDNMEDALHDDFAHSCADCEPRPLNRQQAIERQRAKMDVPVITEVSDKKPKRPPSKTHKRKSKPSELQINGHSAGKTAEHHTKHASAHDMPHHPPKKAKNSHKPSHSISAPAAPKRSPSDGNASTNTNTHAKGGQHQHPPSPATTPPDLPDDFEIHSYSTGFRSLANGRPVQSVHSNSFAELSVSKHMSDWLRNDATMYAETGWHWSDVFQKLPADVNSKFRVEVDHQKKMLSPGIAIQWQCLRATMPIGKEVPLIEVNGLIGLQNSYCADPQSRWDEFTGPLPFVLFHPFLPLYIDTRKEGSDARFVRRSCRPNATLETYLSEEREYRFWLVSDREIAAKEQITIPWDFRFPNSQKGRTLRILGLADDMEPEVTIDETEYTKLASFVHLVLSEFGGCACDLGTDCAFSRFHRRYLGKNQPKKTKKRKLKAPHTVSPTSTGHATNSRAPSEGHLEDVPEQDRRSISGSSRSKPGSRDLTPTARQGSFDTIGILTEPTDRDKRKVAMVEDSFRRMEQQQQPHRKRKRVSDGTTTSQTKGPKANSAAQTPILTNGFSDRAYVDAATGTSRSKSGSPTSPHTISAGHAKHPASVTESAPITSRPLSAGTVSNYVDAAVQTEPEAEKTAPLRRVVSGLRKRCLDHRHHFRLEEEERRKRQALQIRESVSTAAESPVDLRLPLSSPASSRGSDSSPKNTDSPMPDAPQVASASRPSGGTSMVSPLKHKSPDLRVQLPPIPAFGSPVSVSAPNSASTPLSAGGSVVQSPFSVNGLPSPFGPPSVQGVAATPSPVKKKMSLSDYRSRYKARPVIGTTLKPIGNTDDPKSATSVGTSSPTAEKEKEKDKGNEGTTQATTDVTNSSVS